MEIVIFIIDLLLIVGFLGNQARDLRKFKKDLREISKWVAGIPAIVGLISLVPYAITSSPEFIDKFTEAFIIFVRALIGGYIIETIFVLVISILPRFK